MTPLVIIAIDGVGWNIAEPLLKQGQLPWFQSVLVRGQRGSVTARWPPHWSGPAWAAIATGFDREQTGVIEDLHATAPGLPDFQLPLELDLRLNPLFVIEMELLARGVMTALPMPRMQLRRSPLWERVAAAGGRVGVVRFPFSYPATDESITNLSSLLALDFWDFAVFGGVDRNKLVTPARHAAAIKDVFARSSLESHRVLQQILPNPSWVNSPRDVNRIWVLERLVDINEKTFDAADQVLATSDPFDLFVLYIPGTDTVSHAFWKYRFPEFFPANPPHVENVATLGPVIDRFLQHVDQRLGLILEKMPGANVLVVADHGQFATQSDPIWSGWHAGDGIFAAAGSEVPPSSVMRIVDYQDVVPFALDLMGFEIPEDLPKRSKSLRSVPRGN